MIRWRMFVLVLVGLLLSLCPLFAKGESEGAETKQEVFKIGTILAMTGDGAFYHPTVRTRRSLTATGHSGIAIRFTD